MQRHPMPDNALSGRRALVTGAGRGLGRACAIALAAAGAEVTLVSRTQAELDEVASVIAHAGGSAVSRTCDVTDDATLEATLNNLPTHEILVNSAGANRPQAFLDVEPSTLDWLFSLNFRATFLATQHVVRRLREADRRGVVINVTSQMGHVGAPNRTVYCSTKHAVEGLTKALAVELAPFGIRVVSVAPTFIDTPMTRPFFEDADFRSEVLRSIPLGRLGTVDEVAAAVVFLAGDGAALITGSSLLVDGGWTAR